MLPADTLTVVRHDDTRTDYTDVRYVLTAAAIRILDAAGTETSIPAHDVLTTHAYRSSAPPASIDPDRVTRSWCPLCRRLGGYCGPTCPEAGDLDPATDGQEVTR